jgi:hypothetical protein
MGAMGGILGLFGEFEQLTSTTLDGLWDCGSKSWPVRVIIEQFYIHPIELHLPSALLTAAD